ncbi:TPA: hypothetical protein U1V34_002005 [Streptococcus suis]|nr:hypothetical protein [Streptococcus suis]
MKRILKKCQIWLCIILLIFGAVHKPKTVKADAGVLTGGGMVIGALNPAVLPVVLIGLAACLLLGYTISNWDDIAAFGQAVANELKAMGHSIGEFISGTSVTVNSTFKEAVRRASNSTGDTIQPYIDGKKVYTGSFVTNIGYHSKTGGLSLAQLPIGSGFMTLGNYEIGKADFGYDKDKASVKLLSLSISVRFDPVRETDGWKIDVDRYDGGQVSANSVNYLRNSNSEIYGIDAYYDYSQARGRRIGGIYLRPKTHGTINLTSVSISELGIHKTAQSMPTTNLKTGAVTSPKVDEYVQTAFPDSSTTVTFDQNADVTGATLATIPTISNHNLTDAQVEDLTRIKSGVDTAVNTGADTAIDSMTGTASAGVGAGWDWLSKLWEWLKKLLDAILGLPAAILAGLQALWDSLIKWLTDIWTAITAIPGAISKAWTDALTWAFGVDQAWLDARIKNLRLAFNSKFPNIQAFNYRFGDKSAFDDIRITLPGFGTHAVVSGSAMTAFAVKAKPFISGIFYLLTALFFMRKFYKVSED